MAGRERLRPVCRTSTSLCGAPSAGRAGLRGRALARTSKIAPGDFVERSTTRQSPIRWVELQRRLRARVQINLMGKKWVGRERFERSTT